MMYTKICKCCNKVFLTATKSKKCCSSPCAREMRRRSRLEGEQLCWKCGNACGGCNWSDFLKPVKGWDAEPTIVKDSAGEFSSYKIKKCPEFIRG